MSAAPDPAERAASFGREAEAYDRGRPGYPLEALRAALAPGARRALDLGAGTGKLTRGLLELGLEVVAVEPLAEMRARIPPEAEALDGGAEALPLPDASVDAVLVGQAFHWFDRARALAEVVRVLRPGGRLGLLWNLFDDDVAWVAALADAFGAEDRLRAGRDAPPPWSAAPGLGDPRQLLVRHLQPMDADGLVANVASRSTTILRPPAEREALLAEVRRLAPEGRFEVPWVCDTWVGERAG